MKTIYKFATNNTFGNFNTLFTRILQKLQDNNINDKSVYYIIIGLISKLSSTYDILGVSIVSLNDDFRVKVYYTSGKGVYSDEHIIYLVNWMIVDTSEYNIFNFECHIDDWVV